MRIDRLTVTNFKGFEERTFEFPRSLDAPPGGSGSFHLIIGQNGRGKTSALDALAVAAGSWFLGVRGAESRLIRSSDVRVRVIQFGDTARLEQQLPVAVEARGQVMGQAIRWEREFDGGGTNRKYARNVTAIAEHTVREMQSGVPVTLPLISYYGTGRLWQAPKDTSSIETDADAGHTKADFGSDVDGGDLAEEFASRLAGYRHSIDPQCSPRELLRWLKFEQQLSGLERKESSQFKLVKEAIRMAVEGCTRVEYDLRLGLLLDIEGQMRLPFGALSDGQRNIVAMIGDIAYKAAQLNPHLGVHALPETPGIVLIDEIDLHLHPLWQRHIVDDLRRIFPEIQFVATTHSPFIIQAMREGELMPLDAQPVPETANLSLEDIASGLMGVEKPEVGSRYLEMVGAARHYLGELEQAPLMPEEKLAPFKDRLAQSIAPYADNPAYQAFLEMKRIVAIGE